MKPSLHLLPALELARVVSLQGEVSSTTPLNNNVRVHERYLEPAIAEQAGRLAGWLAGHCGLPSTAIYGQADCDTLAHPLILLGHLSEVLLLAGDAEVVEEALVAAQELARHSLLSLLVPDD